MSTISRVFILLLLAATQSAQAHPPPDNCVSRTSNNATLIIPATATLQFDGFSLHTGDRLTVHNSDGLCVGELVWEDSTAQALAVWGDDEMTSWTDGLHPGERMSFHIQQAETGTTYTAIVATFEDRGAPYQSDEVYLPDALYVVSSLTGDANHSGKLSALTDMKPVAAPDDPVLSTAYPNPFNPQTEFTLTLHQPQHVRVDVYNTNGQCVTTLHEAILSADTAHRFHLEADSLPSGTYFIVAQGETFQQTQSVVLMK